MSRSVEREAVYDLADQLLWIGSEGLWFAREGQRLAHQMSSALARQDLDGVERAIKALAELSDLAGATLDKLAVQSAEAATRAGIPHIHPRLVERVRGALAS